jgi:hypothetical protein
MASDYVGLMGCRYDDDDDDGDAHAMRNLCCLCV